MSQHDFDIANQTAASARSDINNALQALASLSSGDTAPSTTYANMLWYETDTNILKMRNEANSAWINVGYLDQGSSAFRILDDTQVMNTSGTQTGLLGDQATATWEAGLGTTESLVSPAKVKAAIDALSSVSTTLGAVGTYAYLWRDNISTVQGSTVSGSSLFYASMCDDSAAASPATNFRGSGLARTSTSPSGTWQAMGAGEFGSNAYGQATLYVRIS
jgi:hypothetical protein